MNLFGCTPVAAGSARLTFCTGSSLPGRLLFFFLVVFVAIYGLCATRFHSSQPAGEEIFNGVWEVTDKTSPGVGFSMWVFLHPEHLKAPKVAQGMKTIDFQIFLPWKKTMRNGYFATGFRDQHVILWRRSFNVGPWKKPAGWILIVSQATDCTSLRRKSRTGIFGAATHLVRTT